MRSISTDQQQKEQLVKELAKENVTIRNRNVAQELEAISHAVLGADETHLREAIESVHWERRGWLGRLVRIERPADQIERHTKQGSPREERLVA